MKMDKNFKNSRKRALNLYKSRSIFFYKQFDKIMIIETFKSKIPIGDYGLSALHRK